MTAKNTIYLDIETIPCQNPHSKAAIAAEINPPGSMRKAETIAKWEAEKKPDLIDEKWRKTALDGGRGEIICISFAFDDEPVKSLWRKLGASEEAMLQLFYAVLHKRTAAPDSRIPRFIGHNLLGFDLRFIFHRSVVLGVKPPAWFPHDARGNSDYVYDTMLAWAGWGNRVSMNNLCIALGVEGKGNDLADGEDIDGSKVWEFVEGGEEEKVARYCEADVERTREIYKRLTFAEAPA